MSPQVPTALDHVLNRSVVYPDNLATMKEASKD